MLHTNADLYSGFRQPGHSNEEFLLQVESSKMHKHEGDKQTDHQTNTETGYTQTWTQKQRVWRSPAALVEVYNCLVPSPLGPWLLRTDHKWSKV